MKRPDAFDLYRYANIQFPDDGNLALFNVVYEVMNGEMPYELIDGPAEVVEAPDTDLAAVIGLATVGPQPCRLDWVFDEDHVDQRQALMGLVPKLERVLQPKMLLDLPRPPNTMAVLAACEGADGRFAYALFRNPGLDEAQARLIIGNLFPPAGADDSAPPAPKN